MIVSLLLTLLGLGILARLVTQLAIHALPAAAGLWFGLAAYHAGAGVIASLAVGVIVGAIVFAVGATIAGTARSRSLTIGVGVIFASPAALAGYHLAYRLSGIGAPAEGWREVIAMVGAVMLGIAAWRSISAPRPGSPGWMPVAPAHDTATSHPDAAGNH
ncbi:hypothetical protein [Sphingomonas adhaesiva]|uniref:hypothetical protein n=1 Tax=Sphingomonas adhaesiva TaxID=28212 RepID=UPI002FF5FEC4